MGEYESGGSNPGGRREATQAEEVEFFRTRRRRRSEEERSFSQSNAAAARNVIFQNVFREEPSYVTWNSFVSDHREIFSDQASLTQVGELFY